MKRRMGYRVAAILLFLLYATGMLSSCGREQAPGMSGENAVSEAGESVGERETSGAEDGSSVSTEPASDAEGMDEAGATLNSEPTPEPSAKPTPELDAMQKLFGTECISAQTFEVEMSQYEGKVWFVPYAPTPEEPELRMQIWQDGEVLNKLYPYVPEALEGEKFVSLDAVSFWDVNYDGNADIVLLETYGDTMFAAVYCYDGGRGRFYPDGYLSEHLTALVSPLTIPEIRSFLTGDKKNGEFSSWQEAYETVSRIYDLGGEEGRRKYDLIYFDEDDIPELVADVPGYWMSLYTYHEGSVYLLMDGWGYGAWGVGGYEYAPGKNSLRVFDADYAGAIVYTTYATVGPEHSMETVVTVKTLYFGDLNGDGYPDEEDEYEDYEPVSYIDGIEVSQEEWDAYEMGDYEYIESRLTLEDLEELLEKFGR